MAPSERLDLASYAADEVVGIAAVSKADLPGPVSEERWRYIPDRLWHRVLHLAAAYELHIASVLEPAIDTVLNREQCASAVEELSFLQMVVRDPASQGALTVMLDVLGKASRAQDLAVIFVPRG